MEILWVLLAIGSIVFWMNVAWRAMLAHERLANAAEHLANRYNQSSPQ
jgi:uncharacterized membrane protein